MYDTPIYQYIGVYHMFMKLFSSFKKKSEVEKPEPELFRWENLSSSEKLLDVFARLQKYNFQQPPPTPVLADGTAMDSADINNGGYSNAFLGGANGGLPTGVLSWYGQQVFIGYTLCGIFGQNWLINKACSMPAKDAVRKGYAITVNDGSKVDTSIIDRIKELDHDWKINEKMIEFLKMGKLFGVRIALFLVGSDDPEYYQKPFNLDGVMPGSYRGISQIDPYWAMPELDQEAASNPASPHFYEPTWWTINGTRVHRSHLVIYRADEVADILKPSYFYGGIPFPQRLYTRVYAAERVADEAPELALSKRLTVLKVNVAQALAKQSSFAKRMEFWAKMRDNFAVKIIDTKDEIQQFDLSLADLDDVIMSQYQIVAAIAEVPATKLLGTVPKGFNTTGEYEEASYHETLESLQMHALTPFLERHHMLLIKSQVAPEAGIKYFRTRVAWNPLDSLTKKEQAEINKIQAETGAILVQSGAISPEEERRRIIASPEGGYEGLSVGDEVDPIIEELVDSFEGRNGEERYQDNKGR